MLAQWDVLGLMLPVGMLLGWMLNRAALAVPWLLARTWRLPIDMILRSTDPGSAQRRCIRAVGVQLVTGALAMAIAWRIGLSSRAFAAAVFCGWIVLLGLIDFDTHLLPNLLTLPFMGCGLACGLGGLFVPLSASLIGAIVGWAGLMAVHWGARLMTGRRDRIGQGDAKLLAVVGAWLGSGAVIDALFVACLVCVVAVPAARCSKATKSTAVFAFGPFLAIGGIASILAWPYRLADVVWGF
ncbi:prepilin peptidase [Burkholderia ubonensis]|uniref:prepilin peptidase n=1 Tax=Burkholderia ubonensis TaxID=101571 RepID=UPI00075B1C60|nr:A24 family peptidase [Burkholderia ubonensis]KVV07384.1 hypothetical protein WK77_16485 [Burkholderia ubonensis]